LFLLQLESAVESNAALKEVTRTTFHAARFWLKVAAALNELAMFDTEATFHLLMSALNVGLAEKSEAMLVTAAVFHSTMLPYDVASPPVHAVTAAATLPFVMHTAHVTEPTVHARLNVGHAVWNVEPHAV
jgi:hypothetical protein